MSEKVVMAEKGNINFESLQRDVAAKEKRAREIAEFVGKVGASFKDITTASGLHVSYREKSYRDSSDRSWNGRIWHETDVQISREVGAEVLLNVSRRERLSKNDSDSLDVSRSYDVVSEETIVKAYTSGKWEKDFQEEFKEAVSEAKTHQEYLENLQNKERALDSEQALLDRAKHLHVNLKKHRM